jgi:hypothetical protein
MIITKFVPCAVISKLSFFPHSMLGFKCESLLLYDEQRFLDTPESRSEMPGNVLNVVLEKDGEDQLDRYVKMNKYYTQ